MLQKRTASALLGYATLASATLDCKTGASNGTVYTTGSNTYDIICNYQYGGDTIGASKQANTFDICVGYCDTTAGCVDVVYDSAQYCYLKSSKTNGYASPNWWTAVKRTTTTTTTTTNPTVAQSASLNCADGSSNGTTYNSGTAYYDIICNYQYNGNTLGGSKYADTFAQCVGFCDTTSGCVDVVYSSAKYCWLKSSKLSGYNSPGWWVAVKHTGPGPNLLQNPGFESATSTAWSPADGHAYRYEYPSLSHTGIASEILWSSPSGTAAFTQTVSGLDKTKPYSLSFYYQIYNILNAEATQSCAFTVSVGGTTVFTKSFFGSDATTATSSEVWVSVSTPVTVASATQDVKFFYDCIVAGGPDTNSNLWIDDVSFNAL